VRAPARGEPLRAEAGAHRYPRIAPRGSPSPASVEDIPSVSHPPRSLRLFPVQNRFVSHRFRPGCSVRLSCLVKSVTVFVLHILSSPHVEADRPTSTATKATAVAPYLRHRRMRVRSTTAMAPHIEADRPTSTANRARNIWCSGTSSRSSVRGRRRRLRRALIEPTTRSRRCAAHTRPHRHLQDPRP
jgi:hypothetical protein